MLHLQRVDAAVYQRTSILHALEHGHHLASPVGVCSLQVVGQPVASAFRTRILPSALRSTTIGLPAILTQLPGKASPAECIDEFEIPWLQFTRATIDEVSFNCTRLMLHI